MGQCLCDRVWDPESFRGRRRRSPPGDGTTGPESREGARPICKPPSLGCAWSFGQVNFAADVGGGVVGEAVLLVGIAGVASDAHDFEAAGEDVEDGDV